MVNAGRHMVGKRKTLAMGGALCLLLASCSHHITGPVAWWHDYEGGEIAKDRPPPPGMHAPYPNFAQVPAKPTTLPATQRLAQQQNLSESRDLALAGAAASPLPVVTPAAASAPVKAAPAGSQALTVSSAAATARPAAAAVAPAQTDQEIAPSVVPDIDHPPQLATAAPTEARLADVGGALGNVTPPPANLDQLTVGFDGDGDRIPRDAAPGLIAFAQAHQNKIIGITGYGGDGTRDDADLALGWRRAQAVAAALAAAGVPLSDLRLSSEAPVPAVGRGAQLTLLK